MSRPGGTHGRPRDGRLSVRDTRPTGKRDRPEPHRLPGGTPPVLPDGPGVLQSTRRDRGPRGVLTLWCAGVGGYERVNPNRGWETRLTSHTVTGVSVWKSVGRLGLHFQPTGPCWVGAVRGGGGVVCVSVCLCEGGTGRGEEGVSGVPIGTPVWSPCLCKRWVRDRGTPVSVVCADTSGVSGALEGGWCWGVCVSTEVREGSVTGPESFECVTLRWNRL